MFDRLSAYAPQALAVLRIVTALLFILHGTQKIIGFPASDMTPPLFSVIPLMIAPPPASVPVAFTTAPLVPLKLASICRIPPSTFVAPL